MPLGVFVRGLIIGFSIAAPVGPIGVLCIRRSLAEGRVTGFVSGLGAATADAIYGSVAAFGLTAVSSALIAQQMWMQLAGGAFLCYLGVRTMLAAPASDAATKSPAPSAPRSPGVPATPSRPAPSSRGLPGAYASTLLLTLTNPMTILSFAAIFAGLGLAGAVSGYAAAVAMVAGVFLGSAAWWLLLSTGAAAFRARLTPQGLRWINRASGAIIVLFGIIAIASLVRR